jgi:hypothetical protein
MHRRQDINKIGLSVAGAVVLAVVPTFGKIPAKAESLKMAQVDIQLGRDRDRDERAGRDRGELREGDVTVGVGRRVLWSARASTAVR